MPLFPGESFQQRDVWMLIAYRQRVGRQILKKKLRLQWLDRSWGLHGVAEATFDVLFSI